jgi:ADP-ribosylglycohydrolase
MMSKIVISAKEFQDKVYGCWWGKNIGGTLGGPYEGPLHTHALEFYDPIPKAAQANDDLDLQLVWLQMLEEQGLDPALPHFADYWNKYAARYPWDEYGFFMRNYHRGLRPPVAGCFENSYIDGMGSPIRSEIWAVLHAGDPQAAARMAWKDSAVDHAGGEGAHGEMFWAALQAAAFVEGDPMTLINIGLSMIPTSSRVAQAIREAIYSHQTGVNWGRARERMHKWFGHVHPCQSPINHGFTIIGWLYGKDFGDRLCKAVNCGYDTDCTGATLGATLGIINGMKGIPAKWSKPVGDGIVLHKFTNLPTAPKNMTELTERSIKLAQQMAKAKGDIAFGPATKLPKDLLSRLFRNEMALAARAQSVDVAIELCGQKEVAFHYNGEPVLRTGIDKDVAVTVDGKPVEVELAVPAGWSAKRLGPGKFRLGTDKPVANQNFVTVKLPGRPAKPDAGGKVEFVILGPGEAKGYPVGVNVPKCQKCGARTEQCICQK